MRSQEMLASWLDEKQARNFVGKVLKSSLQVLVLLVSLEIVIISLGASHAESTNTLFGTTALTNNDNGQLANIFAYINLNTGNSDFRRDIGTQSTGTGFVAGATTTDPVGRRFFIIQLISGLPHLLILDTQTGAPLRPPLRLTHVYFSLGFDLVNNTLFGITTLTTNESGQRVNRFAHIDITTGNPRFLRDIGTPTTGFPAGATAVDQMGQRFFIERLIGGAPSLLTLNTKTGSIVSDVALIDQNSMSARTFINLGFDATSNTLFGITAIQRNTTGQITDLYRFSHIDPNSGNLDLLTTVGNQSENFVAGAHTVDSVGEKFFVVRITGGLPSLLILDTQNGTDAQDPLSLDQVFINLGFTSVPLEIQITLDNPQPGQTEPLVGQKVTLAPIGSPAGTTSWIWDFGDGSEPVQMTTADPVEHTYTEGTNAGEPFIVTLAVYDDNDNLLGVADLDVAVHCVLDPNKESAIQDKADCDGDALPNDWEINGIKDENGNMLLDLPTMGADHLHKDIFVEVDYMDCARGGCRVDDTHNHKLDLKAIDAVREIFANAPVKDNPDSLPGITLHVDAGPEAEMHPAIAERLLPFRPARPRALWGVRSQSKPLPESEYFSSSDGILQIAENFINIAKLTFNKERRNVFHYVISGHYLAVGAEIVRGQSLGTPSIGFLMTLAPYEEKGNSLKEQETTFMHELGHNLNLHHGGADNINYKPNYLSIMNYSYGHKGGLYVDGAYQKLDYSQFSEPFLDENSLNESDGVAKNASIPSNYKIRYFCGKDDVGGRLSVPSPIDWNCNEHTDSTNIPANINKDTQFLVFDFFSPLPTQNDWENLIFDGGGIIGQLTSEENLSFGDLSTAPVESEIPVPPDYYDPVVITGPQPSVDNFLLPGEQVTLTFLIKNSQLSSTNYKLEVTSPKNWAADDTLSPRTVYLQSGEEASVNFTVRVPPTTNSGEEETGTLDASPELPPNSGIFVDGDSKRYNIYVISSDDSDGDGFTNDTDNCPFVRNFGQQDSDNNGIGDACEVISIPGDLDHDGDVDQNDVNILLADRNKPVSQSTCGAQCDLDGDGKITALDARKLTLLCTRPRCATQ